MAKALGTMAIAFSKASAAGAWRVGFLGGCILEVCLVVGLFVF